jgi:3D (Asp-Asp-Asp) domain-containing protein|tara:strand:- start:1631 stop:2146 length:516 start_codon:yes stop_codon:yes gene_type:complete
MKNLLKILFWIFISTMIMYGVLTVIEPSKIMIENEGPINDKDSTQTIDTTIIMDSPIILQDSTVLTVCATMYHPVVGQCDDTPDITADQSKIPNIDSCSHLNWIAVSQDLLWFNDGPIRYGDTVYVEAGHKTGYYIVRDAMNRRFKKKIDFLESVGTEAYRYKKATLHINS